MARDPPTAREQPIPTQGGQDGRSLTSNVTPTPMKLKERVQFWSTPKGLFTTIV